MRTWFVIGASRGLGRAIAEEALTRGDQVAVAARQIDGVRDFVERHRTAVLPVEADVTKPDSLVAATGVVENWSDGIDVLVNCAGFGLHGAIEEVSETEAQAIFDTNVFGTLRALRAVLPSMRARRRGMIVNLSSVAGLSAGAGSGMYSATKFAIEAISEALRDEVEPLDIRVLLVEPGAFRTGFASSSIFVAKKSISDYSAAGARAAQIRANSGQEPGDPSLGAKLIVDAVISPDPPFRLLLGSKAHQRARAKMQSLLKDLDRTQATAGATDFPGVSP